ncbi:MAG: 16S rRNA (guanine(966)-N(2))-methyltransferase RsmD [Oscillospiraceae bacterium]|nr:16S rRNA (guanine(966)-N(2))-methyltransferase RsmD [Oscillospiraceae bacterium]
MRIITGRLRGRKLRQPTGNDIRPTTDIVKEAVFSIIQFDIEGKVFLDLFSGTGQMGLEAFSRGAAKVYFADSSAESVKLIKKNVESCDIEDSSCLVIKNTHASALLKSLTEKVGVAFLDPPFERGHLEKHLPLLVPCMSDDGIIICEHEVGLELPREVDTFAVHKTYKYGKTALTVYTSGAVEE